MVLGQGGENERRGASREIVEQAACEGVEEEGEDGGCDGTG